MPGQRERERERGGDPENVGRASLSLEKRWRDPRFVRHEFGREKKAMVRNGECGAKQEAKDSPRAELLEFEADISGPCAAKA